MTVGDGLSSTFLKLARKNVSRPIISKIIECRLADDDDLYDINSETILDWRVKRLECNSLATYLSTFCEEAIKIQNKIKIMKKHFDTRCT